MSNHDKPRQDQGRHGDSHPPAHDKADGPFEQLAIALVTGHPNERAYQRALDKVDHLGKNDHRRDVLKAYQRRFHPAPKPDPKPEPKPPTGGSWLQRNGFVIPRGKFLCGITTMAGAGAIDQLPHVIDAMGGVKPTCMTLFQGGSNASNWETYVKIYGPHSTWQVGHDSPAAAKAGLYVIVTIPTLIRPFQDQIEEAAAGKFNAYYRRAAENFKLTNPRLPIILRFDRESDDDGQPFGAERDKSSGHKLFIARWHQCYRQWADVFGEENVVLSFCVTKRGERGFEEWFPDKLDDGIKDIVKVADTDFYVNTPRCTTAKIWENAYQRYLDVQAEFATKHGLAMAHSEFGVKVVDDTHTGKGGPENDNDVAVTALFEWWMKNVDMMGWTNVYNPDGHSFVAIDGKKSAIEAPRAAAAWAGLCRKYLA